MGNRKSKIDLAIDCQHASRADLFVILRAGDRTQRIDAMAALASRVGVAMRGWDDRCGLPSNMLSKLLGALLGTAATGSRAAIDNLELIMTGLGCEE